MMSIQFKISLTFIPPEKWIAECKDLGLSCEGDLVSAVTCIRAKIIEAVTREFETPKEILSSVGDVKASTTITVRPAEGPRDRNLSEFHDEGSEGDRDPLLTDTRTLFLDSSESETRFTVPDCFRMLGPGECPPEELTCPFRVPCEDPEGSPELCPYRDENAPGGCTLATDKPCPYPRMACPGKSGDRFATECGETT